MTRVSGLRRTFLFAIGALPALLLIAIPAPAGCAQSFSELVKRGFEQLQSRQFEEAAVDFGLALEIEPASEPARKGLARAFAGLASAISMPAGSGRAASSSRRPSKPSREAPTTICFWPRSFSRGPTPVPPGAKSSVRWSSAPDSAAARELSGDIHDREGRLNLAIGEWEAAARHNGSPGLAGKIARGRREMTAEEGMSRESSRYFVILFEREVPRDLVQGFFKALDQAFDSLHDRLGEYPRDELTVLLYARNAFTSITQAPDWAGGLYDGKIRIPVGGLKSVEEASGLQSVLVHEMTHAFLYRMAPVGLPLWFNEGLATAFQGWDSAKIRAYFSEHPPEALGSLADVDQALLGRRGDVTAAYAAARLAIGELEEMRGFGAVRRIIAGVGDGIPFADVFRDEARVEVSEFEDRWRRNLR